MKRTRRNEGFTLIELLIVVAVIAILAALAIPNLISSRKSANETNAIAMLRTMIGAEEQCRSRGFGDATGNTSSYGTTAILTTNSLISWPTGGTTTTTFVKSGYTFADASDSTAANHATKWGIYGSPTTANDGDRSFGASQDGFVRFVNPAVATAPNIATIQGWTALQ